MIGKDGDGDSRAKQEVKVMLCQEVVTAAQHAAEMVGRPMVEMVGRLMVVQKRRQLCRTEKL